jgi:hypothetical protein
MAIVEIECRCGHHGFVAASALPGVLRCCTCDHAEFFRKGCHTVRSRYTAAIDDEMGRVRAAVLAVGESRRSVINSLVLDPR